MRAELQLSPTGSGASFHSKFLPFDARGVIKLAGHSPGTPVPAPHNTIFPSVALATDPVFIDFNGESFMMRSIQDHSNHVSVNGIPLGDDVHELWDSDVVSFGDDSRRVPISSPAPLHSIPPRLTSSPLQASAIPPSHTVVSSSIGAANRTITPVRVTSGPTSVLDLAIQKTPTVLPHGAVDGAGTPRACSRPSPEQDVDTKIEAVSPTMRASRLNQETQLCRAVSSASTSAFTSPSDTSPPPS
ncbi:unnamed protein product, partial [Tilletia caries]